MTPKPEDFLLQAWKQQLDIGLRLIETTVEGAIKMRQVQLEAATETYAKAVATRTQGELASRSGVQPPAAVFEGDANKAFFGMIDDAYRGWLDATQKLYKIEPGKFAEEKLPGEGVAAAVKAKPSRRAAA